MPRGQPPLPPGPMPPLPQQHEVVRSNTRVVQGAEDPRVSAVTLPPEPQQQPRTTQPFARNIRVVHGDDNRNILRSDENDDMDLDDRSLSPGLRGTDSAGRRRDGAPGPPQPLPPAQTAAPPPFVVQQRRPSLPQAVTLPSPPLPPSTMGLAPAPSATHAQVRNFVPPVYVAPLYTHAGAASGAPAAPGPAPAVIAAAAPDFSVVQAGAVAASSRNSGGGPEHVSLPLGPVVSFGGPTFPTKIAATAVATAPTAAPRNFGPPTHSPAALTMGLTNFLSSQRKATAPTRGGAEVLPAQQNVTLPVDTEAQARETQPNPTLPIERARHMLAAARRGNPSQVAQQAPTLHGADSQALPGPPPAIQAEQSATYLEISPVYIPENRQQRSATGQGFHPAGAPGFERSSSRELGESSLQHQHQHQQHQHPHGPPQHVHNHHGAW